jgi:hypothetical protein
MDEEVTDDLSPPLSAVFDNNYRHRIRNSSSNQR